MINISIAVGVSDFEVIRQNNYYYIDKTGLISEILKTGSDGFTLITRPRRFGKTLGMNMLASFFDIQKDNRELFEGLEISRNYWLCEKWMNKWPVVFVSFISISGLAFDSAYEMFQLLIASTFSEHDYLLKSENITTEEKENIRHYIRKESTKVEMENSLYFLIKVMEKHYGKKVILLIDEYDVPLAKASANGYYDQMLEFMKGVMQALKDNKFLQFAVVTGCLKIAKESIFTGTNNFVTDTITTSRFDEYFGFTQEEVCQMLQDAGAEKYAGKVKDWYDGYHFGNFDIYCPWDVLNYLHDLDWNSKAKPQSYWRNTSDNAIIRSFIDYKGESITKKLEILLAGGYITLPVDESVTYDYLHSSENNLWSILYLTGYLTKVRDDKLKKKLPEGMSALMIPNAEIRDIFKSTIANWFDDSAMEWNRKALFAAVWQADEETLTEEINKLLRKTISYYDYKEDFYHAFLAGIFAGAGYCVESNREHGEGRSDVAIFDSVNGRAVVLEVKYSDKRENMVCDCERAIRQIDERMYAKEYEGEYDQILCYGIAFFKKGCLVKKKRETI